jgi:hypothetical protein
MIPSSYTIEYQVYTEAQRKVLKIWESAPPSEDRKLPWLYQINYELAEEKSACEIINHLLEAAGAGKISDYQFTKLNGKIKVMPHPTLKLLR